MSLQLLDCAAGVAADCGQMKASAFWHWPTTAATAASAATAAAVFKVATVIHLATSQSGGAGRGGGGVSS